MTTKNRTHESIRTQQEQPTDQPGSSEKLDQLTFFLGSWHGNGTFFATPWGPEKPIEMIVDVTRELSSTWFLTHTSERVLENNPNPLSAIYVWGYDAASNQFVAYWFDSRSGRATQTSSGWQGDKLIFSGEMSAGGYKFPLRDTFVRKGDRSYHHLGEVQLEGRWIPVDEENMSK